MQATTSTRQDLALLTGRILIALLFVPSGIAKLGNFGRFAASLVGKTLPFGIALPFPELFAVAAVAIEIACPLLILFGLKARYAALLLVAFTLMAPLTSHKFWEMQEPKRHENSGEFYKDLALAGGILFLYASGPGTFSVDGYRGARPRPARQAMAGAA